MLPYISLPCVYALYNWFLVCFFLIITIILQNMSALLACAPLPGQSEASETPGWVEVEAYLQRKIWCYHFISIIATVLK